MMQLPEYFSRFNMILVRYNELGLKSDRVRKRMEERLVFYIKKICNREGIFLKSAQRRYGRLVFEMDNNFILRALEVFPQLIGVHSFSPAFSVSSDFETIKETAISVADEYLTSGDSFALRVRRTKSYPMTSQEVEREIGGLIHDRVINRGEKLSIDLKNPDKPMFVEIRDDKAYFHMVKIRSVWGGNPIEHDKAMLSMWNSWFAPESAMVASQLLIRRGAVVVPAVFDTSDLYLDPSPRFSMISQKLSILAKFYPEPLKIIKLPFQPVRIAINSKLPPNSSAEILRNYEFYAQLLIMDSMLTLLNDRRQIKFLKKGLIFKAFITPINIRDGDLLAAAQKFNKAHFMPLTGFTVGMITSVKETLLASRERLAEKIFSPNPTLRQFSIADTVLSEMSSNQNTNRDRLDGPIKNSNFPTLQALDNFFNTGKFQTLFQNCVENLSVEEINSTILTREKEKD